MQTYEIYRVPPCSCDSEWQRLGEVQASSQADADSQAAQCWKDESPDLLVALPKAETVIVSVVRSL